MIILIICEVHWPIKETITMQHMWFAWWHLILLLLLLQWAQPVINIFSHSPITASICTRIPLHKVPPLHIFFRILETGYSGRPHCPRSIFFLGLMGWEEKLWTQRKLSLIAYWTFRSAAAAACLYVHYFFWLDSSSHYSVNSLSNYMVIALWSCLSLWRERERETINERYSIK